MGMAPAVQDVTFDEATLPEMLELTKQISALQQAKA
jgi:hypothetical protein